MVGAAEDREGGGIGNADVSDGIAKEIAVDWVF